MTVAHLQLLSCATPILDRQFCNPVPLIDAQGVLHPTGNGATCDNFLTANQQILTEVQWQTLMLSWLNSGSIVACTTSAAIGEIKAEIEKLCSKTPCDYPTQQAKKILLGAIERMEQSSSLASHFLTR